MIYKKNQKHFQQSSGVLTMWQKPKITPPKKTVSIVMKVVLPLREKRLT
ncbi:hypothetical protein [Bartonella sp. PS7NMGDW]